MTDSRMISSLLALQVTPARRSAPAHYAELSVVRLARDLDVEGETLKAGTRGTVVGVYADGAAYEVEFNTPFHAVLTLETADLNA